MIFRYACRLTLILGTALAVLGAPRSAEAQAGAPSLPKIGATGLYVVTPGDSLYTIGLRYHLTVADLARLNGIRADAILLPGRGVWVPLSQAANAMANTPAGSGGRGTSARDAGANQNGGRSGGSGSGLSGSTYTVAAGDTLYAISRRSGVDVETLKRWNHLPFDGAIQAGQQLVVGNGHGSGSTATGNGVGDNGIGSPLGDSPATAGAGSSRNGSATHDTYIVQPGDTLTSIAANYNTTASGLKSQNGLDSDLVYVGQSLTVPRQGSGSAGGGSKRIEVVIGEQRMYVWEGSRLVWNFVVSTGVSGYPTRRGTFAVQSKVPDAWSSAWQLWMPSWLGIYFAGSSENGIHALPIINGQRIWAGYLGSPISYGCVVLGTNDAQLLYNWAEIGTPVEIHD